MTRMEVYPAGVPCFVDTMTDDVAAAQRFYGGLFDWEFAGPAQTPGDPPGEYFVARASGLDVAASAASVAESRVGGIRVPPGPPTWR